MPTKEDLFTATYNGDLESVRRLIEEDGSLVNVQSTGESICKRGARGAAGHTVRSGGVPLIIAGLLNSWWTGGLSGLVAIGLYFVAAAPAVGVGTWLVGEINPRGWTPLHFAAAAGSVSIAMFLLEKGVDPGIEDEKGKLFLKIAEEYGYKDFAESLQMEIRNRVAFRAERHRLFFDKMVLLQENIGLRRDNDLLRMMIHDEMPAPAPADAGDAPAPAHH